MKQAIWIGTACRTAARAAAVGCAAIFAGAIGLATGPAAGASGSATAIAVPPAPAVAARDPGRYRIVDVGGLPGYPRSRGVAINALGHLLGQSIGPDDSRAFVYRDGRLHEVGPVGDARWIHPHAIGRDGTVVGDATSAGDPPRTRAFAAVPEQRGYRVMLLPLVPGSHENHASGIGGDGRMVGRSVMNTGEPQQRAYLFDGSEARYLGDSPFGPTTRAQAISPDGSRIVGSAFLPQPGGGETPFLLTGDRHVALVTAGGGSPEAVNDHGVVVGCSSRLRDLHAVYWIDGRRFEIPKVVAPRHGDIGCALAINNAGQVVGYESYRHGGPGLPPDAPKAFLFSAGRSYAIDDLLQPEVFGWRVVEARGIDDAGRIAATARFRDGDERAVLLVPESLAQPR